MFRFGLRNPWEPRVKLCYDGWQGQFPRQNRVSGTAARAGWTAELREQGNRPLARTEESQDSAQHGRDDV